MDRNFWCPIYQEFQHHSVLLSRAHFDPNYMVGRLQMDRIRFLSNFIGRCDIEHDPTILHDPLNRLQIVLILTHLESLEDELGTFLVLWDQLSPIRLLLVGTLGRAYLHCFVPLELKGQTAYVADNPYAIHESDHAEFGDVF